MHGQHHLVALGDTQHLLGDDAPGNSLAEVLHDLPAVHLDAHAFGVVHPLILTLSVAQVTQVRVLDVQAVGQAQALAGNCVHHAHCVHLHTVTHGQRTQGVVCLAPQLRDAGVRRPVRVNDALGLNLGHVHTCNGLEEQLELGMPDPVACAQNHDLAYLPLNACDVCYWLAVDAGRHDLVHVLLGLERIQQVLLASQPRKGSRFDLR